MMRAVKIITIEMITSVAESIQSHSKAKLPTNNPIMIFDAESMALPIVLTQEVLINIFSRDI